MEGPYEGFSDDGPRLFSELERLLQMPNGLQQLFEDFGKRAVCDAILSKEPPLSAQTIAEFQTNLSEFLKSHPEHAHRKFEFTMSILPEEEERARPSPSIN